MEVEDIDKFSDLKNLNISKETKIYHHSWKQRAKISITAKFEEEILQNGNIMAMQSLLISYIIVWHKLLNRYPFQAEMGVQSLPPYK